MHIKIVPEQGIRSLIWVNADEVKYHHEFAKGWFFRRFG